MGSGLDRELERVAEDFLELHHGRPLPSHPDPETAHSDRREEARQPGGREAKKTVQDSRCLFLGPFHDL